MFLRRAYICHFPEGSINNDHTLRIDFKSHSIASSLESRLWLEEEDHRLSKRVSHNVHGLTYVGSTGEAQMVDVSPKEASKRTAIASCKVILGRKVFEMVLTNQMTKGDVLTVAKIAGINGAKQTSSLIHLCHNITLSHVRVDLRLNPENYSVEIQEEASSSEKSWSGNGSNSECDRSPNDYRYVQSRFKGDQLTDVLLGAKPVGKVEAGLGRNDKEMELIAIMLFIAGISCTLMLLFVVAHCLTFCMLYKLIGSLVYGIMVIEIRMNTVKIRMNIIIIIMMVG
ncbi:hypothetical protein K2173_003389 [Erythroxylum novogranatense]|uniref:Molybdopterin cofactor biosynthesis C (MoaC) domain-containing protein n=1 Tax=Erythroxylum novogranatense TaxID=1862640 RepID=A0AAV8S8G8_9ROSI|nr:hypothetical protein K2173_003389 [Erythroxylum novogranatense]